MLLKPGTRVALHETLKEITGVISGYATYDHYPPYEPQAGYIVTLDRKHQGYVYTAQMQEDKVSPLSSNMFVSQVVVHHYNVKVLPSPSAGTS